MENVLESKLYEAFAEASGRIYIYATDMKRGLARWSNNTIKYFKLDSEYTTDPISVWGAKIHPDDRDMYLADIEAVMSGKTAQHSCQYRAMNRYGDYVWLECKGTMTYDEEGNMDVFAGMMIRLDMQSTYDSLTGLPTKSVFYEYKVTDEKGVVLLFGIDNFKKIIDIYGYNYGDEILVEFAKRLVAVCKEKQKLIRFNGDEFLLFLPNAGKEKAVLVFEKLKQIAWELVMKDGRQINLCISGGATTYPIKNNDKEEMINRLELALSYVKRVSKGSMVFYSDTIAKKQQRTSMIKEDLKKSIANDFCGFELYYQPWVDAHGTKILGCEALLRWKGDRVKDVGPVEFIPLLEEDGWIIDVGRWVMKESMKQQKEWQNQYGDFKVSFNVSYQQFLEINYVDELVKTAEEYGVKPENMVLELTESCSVETPENLKVVFEKIREHGFQIALDDFGTGYATMSILRKLPADEIKIDHSFVRELTEEGHKVDFAVIESIMMLCNRLDCNVVVEGVENREVDKIIRGMDATYLQGYYYSKPICKKDFEHMLHTNLKMTTPKFSGFIAGNRKTLQEQETHNYDKMALRALANIYVSIHLLNIKEDTFQEYYAIPFVHKVVGISGRITGTMERTVVATVTDEYVESTLEFVRTDTLEERLNGKQLITKNILGKQSGWCRFDFIPVKYDEQGKLEYVLFAIRTLDK